MSVPVFFSSEVSGLRHYTYAGSTYGRKFAACILVSSSSVSIQSDIGLFFGKIRMGICKRRGFGLEKMGICNFMAVFDHSSCLFRVSECSVGVPRINSKKYAKKVKFCLQNSFISARITGVVSLPGLKYA